MSIREVVSGFAQRPDDSDEVAFQKALIFVVALSCCLCGVIWSALYLYVFGVGLTMALPLGFVVIVGGTIVVSWRMGDHMPLVYVQLACITWVSALIQWSIGNAFDAGLVICWSFLGPIGALLFLPVRKALPWLGMFVVILLVSALVDPALLGAPLSVSARTRSLFLVMNMGASSLIVFAAAAWFVRSLQQALADLKEAQVQLIGAEKQAAVGRLVSGILHEVNTPLGAIQSSTDTLCTAFGRCGDFVSAHADEDSAEGKRALRAVALAPKLSESVTSSVQRLVSVVNRMSRFVSLDESEKKAIDVRVSMDTALDLVMEGVGDRITVKRDYAEELPDVTCFPAKLNQAILSVVRNAVEAIDERGEILARITRDDDRAIVEIHDTGRGIPQDQLQGLFEIGFTKRAGKVSMQLGLPMSKRHIDEIGGRIDIESEPGRGTTVRVSLPSGRAE
jgi:signal transduction histidine kinase